MKVDLSINPSLLRGIKEVCNVWKGVSVLLNDSVETAEVVAKSKRTILLFDKEDMSGHVIFLSFISTNSTLFPWTLPLLLYQRFSYDLTISPFMNKTGLL